MYAIIETGGKQYKVEKDTVIEVEKLNAAKGKEVTFGNVLLASSGEEVKIGQPYLAGAKVTVSVVNNLRTKKVIAFKYTRRKSSKTRIGHRQDLTRVKINEIYIEKV